MKERRKQNSIITQDVQYKVCGYKQNNRSNLNDVIIEFPKFRGRQNVDWRCSDVGTTKNYVQLDGGLGCIYDLCVIKHQVHFDLKVPFSIFS